MLEGRRIWCETSRLPDRKGTNGLPKPRTRGWIDRPRILTSLFFSLVIHVVDRGLLMCDVHYRVARRRLRSFGRHTRVSIPTPRHHEHDRNSRNSSEHTLGQGETRYSILVPHFLVPHFLVPHQDNPRP